MSRVFPAARERSIDPNPSAEELRGISVQPPVQRERTAAFSGAEPSEERDSEPATFRPVPALSHIVAKKNGAHNEVDAKASCRLDER